MKILFIGGTGVISSSCSELCIEKGFDLFLLNRGKSFRTPPQKAKLINADISDIKSVESALNNQSFDVIVDWIAFNENDVKRDYELFHNRTKQYIFISSASAYHKPPIKLPITEDVPLVNPFWKYSQAKIDCENFLMNRYLEDGFPVTICRPSHTYDKTKPALRMGYLPFHRMKNGKKIIIHGDGNTLWTLTHTRDFARGFFGLIGNINTIGQAYHITSNETVTWNQIAEILADKSGYELKLIHIPIDFIAQHDKDWGAELYGDKAYDTYFDNSKIKKIVPEFDAAIPLQSGAEEIADWYKQPSNQTVNETLDNMMDIIISNYEKLKG
ncbi:MAG: SDR family oxidoreductase [Melioribacter sp.]|nr:SDR family oxidoreductase [Melioribacter sp.]